MTFLRTIVLLNFCAVLSQAWTCNIPRSTLQPSLDKARFRTARFSGDGLDEIEFESEETKKEAVGNLVADDEWMGVSMQLGEVVHTAVLEDLKKNARDFLGKEEYELGDISKQVDTRVKEEIANLRGKDECKFFHGIKIVSGARLL